jgi:hypothetical protein
LDESLAFEENDVFVVFVDFAIGVGSPQFLDFVGCFVPPLLNVYASFH